MYVNGQPASGPGKVPQAIEEFLVWRDALWEQHPVVVWDATFLLPTPPLVEIGEGVASDIYLGRSGTAYYGDTRYGKSSAIRYLIARIREAFEGVAVVRIAADASTRPTDSGFYGDLLIAAHFPLRKGRTGKDRREQVKDLYWSAAKNGDGRRLILFVDEAQNWSESEWAWLKTIQIHLYENLIAMVVISFGQEQLLHRRNALRQSGRRDLTDRFLRRITRFRGIVDAHELGKVFESFDTTNFPNAGGASFSEFFYPRAFRSGWRFAQEGKRAFEAFLEAGGKQAIGMDWIALACKFFLTEFIDKDRAGWSGGLNEWRQAIAFSDWGHDDDGAS